jgi:hypothetical protein
MKNINDILVKKINDLRDCLKSLTTKPILPAISEVSSIPNQSLTKPSIKPAKIPSPPPGSKKDPKKVAEQLKAAEVQKLNMPVLKFDTNGQWSLDKTEIPDDGPKYHIHKDGYKITTEPMSLKQINNRFGSVKHVESTGHMLVPHDTK